MNSDSLMAVSLIVFPPDNTSADSLFQSGSAADCGEYRQVAGAGAEVLNEPETKRKKAAFGGLSF
jgi:hypothetical protein